MTQVHELNEDDCDRRLEFCEVMNDKLSNQPDFLNYLIFSDEATFCLNGEMNRQNCRYWATENPHWMQESHTQNPQKLNVWAGFTRGHILGPYFFDGSLNGDMYLDFLRFELIPALAILFPNNENPDLPSFNVWYQQDGAPPHYSLVVREYLNEVFPNRWVGRRGPMEWPARSPDLTPLDFFLWGYLKSRVYYSKPRDLEELRERIRFECRHIDQGMRENVLEEFQLRLYHCQETNGWQFEHLL